MPYHIQISPRKGGAKSSYDTRWSIFFLWQAERPLPASDIEALSQNISKTASGLQLFVQVFNLYLEMLSIQYF
jgi:hypothetical protein